MSITPKKNKKQQNGLTLQNIQPLTDNQKEFFRSYNQYQVMSLTGSAGSGKSFIGMYKALSDIQIGSYQKCVIIRSSVSSRSMGFLPGNQTEKMGVYESPYISICSKLYGRGDAYSILKQKGLLSFESSSFLRGETFEDSVIIIDEAQNMSWNELYTILTRLGGNCKLIICGDILQDDLTSERYNEVSGYGKLLRILDNLPECRQIYFDIEDIVRSGFVKSFIIACQDSY